MGENVSNIEEKTSTAAVECCSSTCDCQEGCCEIVESAPETPCCISNEGEGRELDSCCPPSEASSQGWALWQSVGVLLGLIAAFLVADYWFGAFLESRLTGISDGARDSLSFFISHSIGLLSLLAAITTIAVFVRSFIDAEKVRGHMETVSSWKGHSAAAAIGMATPFCSCSAVPVFTGFIRAGVPVSQALSFLVASPLVNEIAIIMLAASVGWGIAGAYAAMGFVIAVGAGISLRRFAKPSLTEVRQVVSLNVIDSLGNVIKPSLEKRAFAALLEAKETVKTTFVYILIGVGVGSLIHGWVPTSAIQTIASWGPVVGVLAATAIGVPLYSGIATVIPIITALSEKGLPVGTLLAFAMSVTALSFPEALLLRKVMKPKLLAAYFGVVTLGIIFVGIIFNVMLGS
jgi:uncharacterized membrane protein YraQ (UPF0718 family)